VWVKIAGQSDFGKDSLYAILVNRGCTNFVIYFHLTCGLPIWLGFFSYKDVAAGFGNVIVPLGSLTSCSRIFKCGKDSLMFQNPFFIRIPYSSKLHKERKASGI
jgi:hypothetical protein